MTECCYLALLYAAEHLTNSLWIQHLTSGFASDFFDILRPLQHREHSIVRRACFQGFTCT